MFLCFTRESDSITYKTTNEISKAHITEGKIGSMHKVSRKIMYYSNEEKCINKVIKNTFMLILKKLQGKLNYYTHYHNPAHLIGMCMRVLIA